MYSGSDPFLNPAGKLGEVDELTLKLNAFGWTRKRGMLES